RRLHRSRGRGGGGGDGGVRARRRLPAEVRRGPHRRRSRRAAQLRGADRVASPLRTEGRAGARKATQKHLVCIGFMGAGKSTAARSASAAPDAEAIDVDRAVEQRLGKRLERVRSEGGGA